MILFLSYNFSFLFSDRLRTTTNVWGDAVGAAVVQKLSQNDIDRLQYMQRPPQPVDNAAFAMEDVQPPGSVDEDGEHMSDRRSPASSQYDIKSRRQWESTIEQVDERSHRSV